MTPIPTILRSMRNKCIPPHTTPHQINTQTTSVKTTKSFIAPELTYTTASGLALRRKSREGLAQVTPRDRYAMWFQTAGGIRLKKYRNYSSNPSVCATDCSLSCEGNERDVSFIFDLAQSNRIALLHLTRGHETNIFLGPTIVYQRVIH